ncbi:MFS transporter [Actinomycetospora chibensis]|uniref:MFS transporter n=1 Tax=Actinomycetospora chibensis TaxID=663606 RepID=A0ABV9RCI6_9PSEU|nr:MFS transporter [Actinomycetospora chibensis]MDD7927297.1 MFS transporter [Actinomycetospora chibensis]
MTASRGPVGGPAEPGAGVALAPLLAVCSGYFMVILDVTIVNVAAPAIGRELATSLTDLQWIVDGYSVAFAGLLLLGGALGDRWGHRRVFCLGVSVFTGASLGCVVAGDALTLTVFRLVEGCGAALLVPASLALLQQVHPTPEARARAFGLWGAIAGVAATAGPLVGGVLTSTVGWRWVFVINLPVGLLCLAATLATVGPSPRDPRRVIDPLGQAAVVVTVAALIAALNEVGRQGIRGPAVVAGVLVAAVAAGVFVLRERYGAHPPLPRPLVGSRPLLGGTAIGLLFNFGFYGMIFAASVYFQQHEGFSAALAGVALLPAVAVTMVASGLSGRLADRYPHQRLMLVGLLTACLGLTLWAVVGEAASYAVLVIAMVACGFGTSFTLTGATSTVMGAAPADYAGTASATLNTARQTGSAAGVAIAGSLVAAAGLPAGVTTFMAVGAAGYLLAAVLTVVSVPVRQR